MQASACTAPRRADNAAMTQAGGNDKKAKESKKTGRLAMALRENLRRRKAQLRQRSAPKPTKDG
jgi:hypothetical protein